MKANYKFAPVNRRIAAKLIDFFIGLTLAAGVVIPFKILGFRNFLALPQLLLPFGYWLFADGNNGQSIGKRVMQLKVIDYRAGYPCTLAQSFYRNVAGFGILRVFQIAEESDEIATGKFMGQVVIDLRGTGEPPPLPGTEIAEVRQKSNIDIDGIAEFLKHRKDGQ